jgi:IclR family transcriptional regulator, acetate operon repressor
MKSAKGKRAARKPAGAAMKAHRSAPLGRALQIVGALVDATRPLASAEIAKQCGIDASTAHRLVRSLVLEGYVLRNSAKRYVASPKLLFPLPLYHPWNVLRRDAEPILLNLRDQLGFTTGLVVFCLGERILVELMTGRDALSPDYRTWLASPLHASGSGKVLLMAVPAPVRRSLLGAEPLEKFTDHTVTSLAKLESELGEAARRGYVLACDDYIAGFRVVAAPVRTAAGEIVGCLFSSGRMTTFSDAAIPQVGVALKNAAEVFSFASPALHGLGNLLSAMP